MILKEAELITRLKSQNNQFSHLYNLHEDYKKKLSDYNKQRFLTPEEEVQEKKIKKLKLQVKDQMVQILRNYNRNM